MFFKYGPGATAPSNDKCSHDTKCGELETGSRFCVCMCFCPDIRPVVMP